MSLFDTDAVVEMLSEKRYEPGSISVITLIEVLRGISDDGKRAKVKALLEESFTVLDLDNKVIEVYCNMYRKLKGGGVLIPDADLLIAATATANNAMLKTGDEHFRRLKTFGLRLKE